MWQKDNSKHVFCNISYKVHELRRETLLIEKYLNKDIAFKSVHDGVVAAPGELETGTGKQYAAYSPWYRSWMKHA